MRITLVAADIDGTLTLRRGELLLSIEAIEAVRRLEEHGIRVSLVSGNSLPVTVGLARYIGAGGPVVAENGCVVFWKGEIIHVCEGRPPQELVEEILRLGFSESWQNRFRFHDLAFRGPQSLIGEAARIAERYGFVAISSGYALHIQPPGGGKGRGVEVASRLLGSGLENVAAVGDGENDIPMLEVAGFSACPADADDSVKEVVDYVASKPGGSGFAEIAGVILEGRI